MFQKKVIDSYISRLDGTVLQEKYALYSMTFLSEEKQKNIRASNEEQYQEGFLRDLFVTVFGYTIKPESDYNLFTEAKNKVRNRSNAKKADGAICEANNENNIKCVIELKGTSTRDLDLVAFQAFSYKNFHTDCRYVIVSNFEKLRFYVEVQSDFEEFNLFNLSFDRFCVLYVLLEASQLMNDMPLKIKNESLSEEKQITDDFYSVYSAFKRLLFEDLKENNPGIDKLLLFKKTQKLLDRILFIRFCEDRKLLPTNSTIGIISDYKKLKELGYYQPLYNVFRTFFDRIDKGFVHGSDKSKDVFAYNGGLFKPDETLDSIKVSDDVLRIHCNKLAQYNFESQISVDILGRIFENSLTEIEEIEKEIEAEKQGVRISSDNKGKRKKDGVFYTPEYITRYIVENTIGVLCDEKRKELEINADVYSEEKKYTEPKVAELEKRLKVYSNWLFDLKILDCACGSGAFLNAALRQLRNEHRIINAYFDAIHEAKAFNFETIEKDNSILENNLYGVDINEDSIEITKLSLWLNTAKYNRKLATLSGNIKCGNSLIDDAAVAGEKAFDWGKEFPEVLAQGGFDVVIGNPPYVSANNIKNQNEKEFYKSNFKTAREMYDLYSLFTERTHHLLKENGLFGFIFSNSWLGIKSFYSFREFLSRDVKVSKLVELPEKVFADATVKTCICFYANTKPTENDVIDIYKCENGDFFSKGFVLPYKQILESETLTFSLDKSIELNRVKTAQLKNIVSFSFGIKSADDRKFLLETKINDDCFLYLRGRDIKRYCDTSTVPEKYMWYDIEEMKKNINARPRIKENFLVCKKIVIQAIAQQITATLDKNKYLCNDSMTIIYDCQENYSLEYILALLNSRLVNFWFKNTFPSGLNIKINQLELIPIPEIPPEQQKPLIDLADKMLSLNAALQKDAGRFVRRIKETYGLEKTTQGIEGFYNLTFADFAKELAKQKVRLSLKQKDELEEYFDGYKARIAESARQIAATDAQINALVYALYALTAEEIAVVEGR